MKASLVPEWPGSSILSVGMNVVRTTVPVILRMVEMIDQGLGDAKLLGEGKEPTGMGEEVRTNSFLVCIKTMV